MPDLHRLIHADLRAVRGDHRRAVPTVVVVTKNSGRRGDLDTRLKIRRARVGTNKTAAGHRVEHRVRRDLTVLR